MWGHVRSICPSCRNQIAPYDLIPVLSWVLLRGTCRACALPISTLYPAIELFTALLALLFFKHPAYFVFISALIITIRSDVESLLISRHVTLHLIPLALFLSYTGYLKISFFSSIAGAGLGYGLLFALGKIYFSLRHREGIGEGDRELLAFIGSFLGPQGVLIALSQGSFIGCLLGVFMLAKQAISHTQEEPLIPFGLCLALGALFYLLGQVI